jgi:hypothetical protein
MKYLEDHNALEIYPTRKEQIRSIVGFLLGGHTDCMNLIYRMYQEVQEEETREYRTKFICESINPQCINRILRVPNAFPIHRNLTEWAIKTIGPTQPWSWRRKDLLQTLEMMGGFSEECGRREFNFLMDEERDEWITGGRQGPSPQPLTVCEKVHLLHRYMDLRNIYLFFEEFQVDTMDHYVILSRSA